MKTTRNAGGQLTKLMTDLKGKQADALYWSPAGWFVFLAGMKGYNGQLVLLDVDELNSYNGNCRAFRHGQTSFELLCGFWHLYFRFTYS